MIEAVVEANQAATETLRSAQRLLVVRTDDLGDNVLGGAFPAAVARSIPGRCGLIAPTGALGLIPTGGLDFVAGVDCRPRSHRDVARAGRQLAQAMRAFGPDVVLLPRFDFEREALALALAMVRPPTTITWSTSTTAKRRRRNWWLRGFKGPRLDSRDTGLHELDRLRAFARLIGSDDTLAPRLSGEVRRAPLPAEVRGRSDHIVALGIGAAQAKRIWAPRRYAELATTLSRAGYTPVLLGSPDEKWLSGQVRRAMPPGIEVLDLVGRLALPATARLISDASLFVGNDSGLGHIAAAAGTPTVTISCHPVGADTDHVNAPERYRPYVEPGVVVRPPHPATPGCAHGCQARHSPCCLNGVPADAVSQAACDLLSIPAARRS